MLIYGPLYAQYIPMKECSKEMNFPGDSTKSKGGIREDESTSRVGSGARNLPA